MRTGGGPRLFEVTTYRWREHVGPGRDYQLGYRTEDECQPFVEADPVNRLAVELPAEERARIEAAVEAEVRAAFAFAEESPFPDAAELMTDIFQEETDALAASRG
jgi:pyruvate dehydrogenase E1 component alpha subunit